MPAEPVGVDHVRNRAFQFLISETFCRMSATVMGPELNFLSDMNTHGDQLKTNYSAIHFQTLQDWLRHAGILVFAILVWICPY